MTKKIAFDLQYYEDWRCVYVNDWRAPEDFRAQAAEIFPGMVVAVGSVHMCFARWTPYWDWENGNGEYGGQYLAYPVKPGRGAFEITYSENFTCEELDDD